MGVWVDIDAGLLMAVRSIGCVCGQGAYSGSGRRHAQPRMCESCAHGAQPWLQLCTHTRAGPPVTWTLSVLASVCAHMPGCLCVCVCALGSVSARTGPRHGVRGSPPLAHLWMGLLPPWAVTHPSREAAMEGSLRGCALRCSLRRAGSVWEVHGCSSAAGVGKWGRGRQAAA